MIDQADSITRLDALAAPLEGTSLIEASAGTGKTYTITGLYLRLVLETDCRVDEILVVTYTIAATEELRDRIRRRLVDAERALRGDPTDDAFLGPLIDRLEDRPGALDKVQRALRAFDEAAIFTIHGFCQRVLVDGAFESAMPFETEIVADPRDTAQEVVDDFWRREMHEVSPMFVRFLLDSAVSPEGLCGFLLPYLGKPDLQILGEGSDGPLAEAEARLKKAYREARRCWREHGDDVRTLVSESASLHGGKYAARYLGGWFDQVEAVFATDEPSFKIVEKDSRFEKFTESKIVEGTKQKCIPPKHEFFGLAEELLDATRTVSQMFDARLVSMKERLLGWGRDEIECRNRANRVQTFDDLVVNLLRALRAGEGRGERLATSIRGRYRAALIDEFQDTDPVQYEVFDRIYGGHDNPVFLVGDPKQAIYSFRGADIFAYLEARAGADRQFTLDVNWRSNPRLIEAVNTIFARSEDPFLHEGIPFLRARAAERPPDELLEDGVEGAPMRIWRVRPTEENRSWSVDDAVTACSTATAAEISRLLTLAGEGRALIGDRPLAGGDIAVLVRTHRHGRAVRDALLQLGVPSVQHAQEDVFSSPEANELERVLLAVVEPSRENLVRSALATDLIGIRGDELFALAEDEKRWVEWIERFHEFHGIWRDRGFIRMFRTVVEDLGVAQRLLAYRDGERRLTNLLHIAELLQAKGRRNGAGMEGVVQWLSDRSGNEDMLAEDDDRLLRLESDENLVKIVTMHRSKGLEYPVVFCPFAWHGFLWGEKETSFLFHGEDGETYLDIGTGNSENRDKALQEERAENLRLLYVALTRARVRTYLAWGAIHNAPKSAPTWLLHPEVKPKSRDLSGETIERDLAELVAEGGGSIDVSDIRLEVGERYRPAGDKAPVFESREFDGQVAEGWRMSSFSSLTAGAHATAHPSSQPASGMASEAPDHDSIGELPEVATEVIAEERTIHDLPAGARTGTCLHLIFERIDFAWPQECGRRAC